MNCHGDIIIFCKLNHGKYNTLCSLIHGEGQYASFRDTKCVTVLSVANIGTNKFVPNVHTRITKLQLINNVRISALTV